MDECFDSPYPESNTLRIVSIVAFLLLILVPSLVLIVRQRL